MSLLNHLEGEGGELELFLQKIILSLLYDEKDKKK